MLSTDEKVLYIGKVEKLLLLRSMCTDRRIAQWKTKYKTSMKSLKKKKTVLIITVNN